LIFFFQKKENEKLKTRFEEKRKNLYSDSFWLGFSVFKLNKRVDSLIKPSSSFDVIKSCDDNLEFLIKFLGFILNSSNVAILYYILNDKITREKKILYAVFITKVKEKEIYAVTLHPGTLFSMNLAATSDL